MSKIKVTNLRHESSASDNISLDSSGRVGIGTASPARNLAINGSASEGVVQITNNTSGTSVGNGLEIIHFTNGETDINNRPNASLRFSTNGTEKMRINGSGNVGIGTASPAQALTIGGVSSTPADFKGLAFQSGSSEVNYVRSVVQDGNNYALSFGTYSGSLSEKARITSTGDFKFNSGYGSVGTAYGVRAWVNFNGQGTVAIRASGNVSSITDSGTGKYRANFTNSMPDAYYAAEVTVIKDDAADNNDMYATIGATGVSGRTPTTTYVPITTTRLNTALVDCPVVNVVIIR